MMFMVEHIYNDMTSRLICLERHKIKNTKDPFTPQPRSKGEKARNRKNYRK